MQLPVLTLGSVLLLGSVALVFSDYGHVAAESALGLRLGTLYALQDLDSVEDVRSRIDKIGFAAAGNVYRGALERNAGSADRWSDVGEALLSTGDRSLAGYCYRRAAELAPSNLQILLNIGDFYSKIGDSPRAVAAFSNILRQSNNSAERILRHNTFVYYENMRVRQNGMLGNAVPDAASALDYVHYLMEEAGPQTVLEVWRWSQEEGFDSEGLTVDCVNYLFQKQKFEAAREGWNRHFADREGFGQKAPVVFNGGFEHELAGSPFDWHFNGFNGVNVLRDAEIFDEGLFSLRIEFAGNNNPDFRHVSQIVFVTPGRYRFEAHIRTAGITSDQGVRFSIRGSGSNRLLAETDALTGTNSWRRTETEVDVPAGITMAEVALVRHRSIRIDNQLTGIAWIDAVKLTRLN